MWNVADGIWKTQDSVEQLESETKELEARLRILIGNEEELHSS